MRELLLEGLRQMGLSPTGEQADKLCRYAELLLEQNQVMNLTAITEPEQVARLHFMDSASILVWPGEAIRDGGARAPRPTSLDPAPTGARSPERAGLEPAPTEGSWLNGKSLIDVGTGAGFPGVVLKILEPSISLTLVDSLGKRVAWLETVCQALELEGVRCIHARAEELALEPGFRDSFDAATSRAVASYPLLCELCLPYVRPGGIFLAMKSVESGEEVRAGENAVKTLGGKAAGSLDYAIPGAGVTHRLVGAEKISATPKGYPRSWGKIKKAPL